MSRDSNYYREWVEKNREKVRAYSRKHYRLNRPKCDARVRAWQAKNPEKITAYRFKYYWKNPAKGRAATKRYRATSPKYRQAKREHDRAVVRELHPHYLKRGIKANRGRMVTPEILAATKKRIQAIRSQKFLKLFHAANLICKAA